MRFPPGKFAPAALALALLFASNETCRAGWWLWHPVVDPGPGNYLSGAVLSGSAGTASAVREPAPGADLEGAWDSWWNGKSMLAGSGNPLFDFRGALADRGLTFTGYYQGAFFGAVAAQGGAKGFWDEQLAFGADLDFGKMLAVEPLEGLTAFILARYRDSWPESNPNTVVDAQSMFNPSNWTSGAQCRLLSLGMYYGTGSKLPVKDMVVLRLGWMQPQRDFLDQPLSKLFLNNAVNSAKGIGGNIPFSSSFSTWGGVLKLRLHETVQINNAIYMSYPNPTATANHGLQFNGTPGKNGLFYIGEGAWTPLLGEARLPGKYAFGGYFYGTPGGQTTTWNGNTAPGQYGFYFQADQMLYREPQPATEPAAATAKGGKDFKEAVPAKEPALRKQGLSTFNMMSFAPGYAKANNFPFYFQSGLVYTGLLPGRSEDLTMASIGYGAYQGGVGTVSKTYTAVLEGGYRWQINGWSYVQPFAQYFVRPNGTSQVQNAAVLGFLAGLVF